MGRIRARTSATAARWVPALVVLIVGCAGSSDGSLGDEPLTLEVPAEVEGTLDVSVEEGPVGVDGVSQLNFGSIELDGARFVLVEITDEVVRAAGLDRDELVSGPVVRAQIELEGERFDPRAPTYPVASIEILDTP